jgi:hypothetical protein
MEERKMVRKWMMATVAAWMLAAAGPVLAQTPPSMVGKCMDSGELRSCDGATLVSLTGLELQSMWKAGDFKGIETQLQSWCNSDEKFPDGQSKLITFESAISTYFGSWNEPRQIQAQLEKWRETEPRTLSRALVEYIFWNQYAWQARGNGYADTVSPEGWALFHQRMAHAVASLEGSEDLAGNCAVWHSMRVEQLMEIGAPRAQLVAAYEAGVKRFPGYHPLHFAMGTALLPKWGGSDAQFDRFARGAARLTAGIEGNGMYARLYWTRDSGKLDLSGRQSGAGPDWKLIRSGFDDLMQRFPDSTWNMNEFASMACRANDKATYLKWRRQLGEVIEPGLWPSSYSVDICDYRFHENA